MAGVDRKVRSRTEQCGRNLAALRQGRPDRGWLPESALIVKNHHGKQRGFVFSEGDIADFA